jgi:urease accessory protein
MPDLACVYIITTSGCILQGDRFAVEIDLRPGARAHVTTQAATKIHSMDANYATQTQHIVLHENSYLEYIPGPVIPHGHSRFTTATHVSIAASATLFYAEILMPGRKYHGAGEVFKYDLYSCAVRAERPEGRELFAEKYIIEPQLRDVRNVGVMGPFDVFANVLLLTPKAYADRVFDQTSARVDLEGNIAAGASRLPNDSGVVFKVLGMETEAVRAKVREFWSLVRQTVMDAPLPPPVAWR